jgi:hypothetical protein
MLAPLQIVEVVEVGAVKATLPFLSFAGAVIVLVLSPASAEGVIALLVSEGIIGHPSSPLLAAFC